MRHKQKAPLGLKSVQLHRRKVPQLQAIPEVFRKPADHSVSLKKYKAIFDIFSIDEGSSEHRHVDFVGY